MVILILHEVGHIIPLIILQYQVIGYKPLFGLVIVLKGILPDLLMMLLCPLMFEIAYIKGKEIDGAWYIVTLLLSRVDFYNFVGVYIL